MVKYGKLKTEIGDYYTDKIRTHGSNFLGVDWNSYESQQLRFSKLLEITDKATKFSINDLGCGYGALYDFLTEKNYRFSYCGFDISQEMVKHANGRIKRSNCSFIKGDSIGIADYTVASGIFNVRLNSSKDSWLKYILSVLRNMNKSSKHGFSFNMLTKYSDVEFKKNYLYYADPCYIFDYCKRHYSKNVALLHDYGLYEFTILIRK